MKIRIVLACFVYLLIFDLTDSQNQPSNPQPSDKIAEHYYYKCYNQTRDLKVFQKLSNDVTQFLSYLEYTFSFIPDRRKIFCDSERKQLNLRIEEIANDLRPCLPSEEKYLADFIQTSFKEFIHFFCHNDGENMNRLFSASNTQCRQNLEVDMSLHINNCFGKIFKPLSGHLSKKDLCDDISVAQKCFALILDEKCPSSSSYKELNNIFFGYINKPCSGCVSQVNVVLFMLSIALSYLFGKN